MKGRPLVLEEDYGCCNKCGMLLMRFPDTCNEICIECDLGCADTLQFWAWYDRKEVPTPSREPEVLSDLLRLSSLLMETARHAAQHSYTDMSEQLQSWATTVTSVSELSNKLR